MAKKTATKTTKAAEKVASPISAKADVAVQARELVDSLDRRVYPLPTVPERAQMWLATNTSLRALLTALLTGPQALADELQHAWVTPPAWLTSLLLEDKGEGEDGEEPVATLPTPPYAVFRCRWPLPYSKATSGEYSARQLAEDFLAAMMESASVHALAKAFLTPENRGKLVDQFELSVSGNIGSVRPITFDIPAGLSDLVMRSTIRFSYVGGESDALVIEWTCCPIF